MRRKERESRKQRVVDSPESLNLLNFNIKASKLRKVLKKFFKKEVAKIKKKKECKAFNQNSKATILKDMTTKPKPKKQHHHLL